jgi:hypothetical protein
MSAGARSGHAWNAQPATRPTSRHSVRRSDLLHNISRKSGPDLRPIGSFATWQAERVIGDHDRNMLRLRLDPRRRARQALSQI